MEEDIEFLEKRIEHNKLVFEKFGDHIAFSDVITKAIENLINKYKELEKERDDIYADYQDLGKEKLKLEEKCEEQEKMIELMLADLSDDAFYMDDNEQYCEVKHKECDGKENVPCRNCLLEYYEKKAKGE